MKLYKVTCENSISDTYVYVVAEDMERASCLALDILKERRAMLSGHVITVDILADTENDISNYLVVEEERKKDVKKMDVDL